MTLAERFYALYRGYERAFGKYVIEGFNEKKHKKEGRAFTAHEPMTLRHVEEHLEGKCGIGSVPLREDNTVKFCVIDVDQYKDDALILSLEKQVRENNLPLVVCRSKSGGAHLYMFMFEPVEAALAVSKIKEIAAFLGFGEAEIFPKQLCRAQDLNEKRKDIGNWINLPYFGGDNTERYAILNGKKLTTEQFLEHVEVMKQTEEQLQEKLALLPAEIEELFLDGPPCLKFLAKNGGFPPGTRNDGMYNVGVYLKKRFPEGDVWKDKFMGEYNNKMCGDSPRGLQEITTLVSSVEKREYNYTCRKSPICNHCNRTACQKEKYGIAGGSAEDGEPIQITNIQRYLGDPVIWGIEVDGGGRMMVTTDILHNQNAFNRMCLEKLAKLPVTVSRKVWEKYIAEKVAQADVIPAPEDASSIGQMLMYLNDFVYGPNQARNFDEILADKPYRKDGKIYFRSSAFFKYLENHRFKKQSEHHVWVDIKTHLDATSEKKKIKGKSHHIWVIRDDEAGNIPEYTKTQFDGQQKEVF